MKADRTVIVFGVFLFLVGLAVAWNGYGYVQVERGWTLVISGTIGFCTGLVLIALGLVLRELEAISSSAAKATLFLAKARSDAWRGPEAAELVEPVEPVEAEPAPHRAPPESLPAFAPEPEAVAEEPEEIPPPSAQKPLVKEPPVEEPPPVTEAPAPKAPGWMSRTGSYVASFASARTKNEPPPAATPESPPSDDWLEQAIAREAAAQEPHKPAEIGEARDHAVPPEHEPEPVEELAPPDHEPEPEAEPEPAAEPAPEPAEGPKPEPGPSQTPAIVGHYEAHGARYTMYADGSIDAETAHGVYRFASMEELKRFIENNA